MPSLVPSTRLVHRRCSRKYLLNAAMSGALWFPVPWQHFLHIEPTPVRNGYRIWKLRGAFQLIHFALMVRSNFHYVIFFLSTSTFTLSHVFSQLTSSTKYLQCAKTRVTQRYKMTSRPGDDAQREHLPSMYITHTPKSHSYRSLFRWNTALFLLQTVSCSLGWPQTGCVAEAGLQFLILLPPPFPVLGLQEHHHTQHREASLSIFPLFNVASR